MSKWVTVDGESFLIETCCKCGVRFGLDYSTYKTAKELRGAFDFYCPHGHPQHYKPQQQIDEEERVRQERDRLRQQLAQKDDEIAEAKRVAAAAKGQVTRLRNRAQAGICPCCSRHFTNLERHMASKHKEAADGQAR